VLSDTQLFRLGKHLITHLGSEPQILHPLIPEDIHIDLAVFPPISKRKYWVLATLGMSARAMPVPKGYRGPKHAELMMALPPAWPDPSKLDEDDEAHGWPLVWLTTLAKVPFEHDTFFGPNHTVPNGEDPEPFGPNTQACCMMFRVPTILPGQRAQVELRKGCVVQFLSLVPIYRKEMDYALEQGPEELAAKLDSKRVTEVLDVRRASVV
jgi:hypothetical protein